MRGQTWSDRENDALVAVYFAMLADELAGRRYNKSAQNRQLQGQIGRTRGSIEFKLQNVSAVLLGAGEVWIPGYKPASNFQVSLEDAVARWFAAHPDWTLRLPPRREAQMAEARQIFVETAPTVRNAPPVGDVAVFRATAQKFDVAGRDARNRALGEVGEAMALAHERATLKQNGRPDLAEQVEWTSKAVGDGAGYDISSFAPDGTARLIEVKTTNGAWDRTPFHISANELRAAEAMSEHWVLFRLFDVSRTPRAFELRPPLSRHVELTATSYRAQFM